MEDLWANTHSLIPALSIPSSVHSFRVYFQRSQDPGTSTKKVQVSVPSELQEQLTFGLDLQGKEKIWFPLRLVAPQSLQCRIMTTRPGPPREGTKLQS